MLQPLAETDSRLQPLEAELVVGMTRQDKMEGAFPTYRKVRRRVIMINQ